MTVARVCLTIIIIVTVGLYLHRLGANNNDHGMATWVKGGESGNGHDGRTGVWFDGALATVYLLRSLSRPGFSGTDFGKAEYFVEALFMKIGACLIFILVVYVIFAT